MDFQQVLQVLEKSTNGTVRVWCFEIPMGSGGHSYAEGNASAGVSTMADLDGRSTPGAELNAALALHAAAPDTRLSPREWVERIPSLVERELVRAIRCDAVGSEARGEGKGHAANVIPVSDLVEYLAMCDAVVAGRDCPPRWWPEVRKGGRAVIRGEVGDAA